MTEIIALPEGMDLARAKDIAGRVSDICETCSVAIGHNKYIKVEGWQSIAAEDGACPEVTLVEYVPGQGSMPDGVRAHAVLKRLSDLAIISGATGFVGCDESKDGPMKFWYAKEGKAQTRAVSRVCRHRYAYVVVLMNRGFSTTPYEEMDQGASESTAFDRKPMPPRKNHASEKPAEAVMELTGILTAGSKKVDTKGACWFADLNGRTLWTRDREFGEMFPELDGTEVVVELTRPNPEKPNSYKIVNLAKVEASP